MKHNMLFFSHRQQDQSFFAPFPFSLDFHSCIVLMCVRVDANCAVPEEGAFDYTMCMSTVLCESSCSSGQTAIGAWFFSQGTSYVFCASTAHVECGHAQFHSRQLRPNPNAAVPAVALRQVVRLNVRINEDIEEAWFAVITRSSH